MACVDGVQGSDTGRGKEHTRGGRERDKTKEGEGERERERERENPT